MFFNSKTKFTPGEGRRGEKFIIMYPGGHLVITMYPTGRTLIPMYTRGTPLLPVYPRGRNTYLHVPPVYTLILMYPRGGHVSHIDRGGGGGGGEHLIYPWTLEGQDTYPNVPQSSDISMHPEWAT